MIACSIETGQDAACCETLNILKSERICVSESILVELVDGSVGAIGLRPFDSSTARVQVTQGPIG